MGWYDSPFSFHENKTREEFAFLRSARPVRPLSVPKSAFLILVVLRLKHHRSPRPFFTISIALTYPAPSARVTNDDSLPKYVLLTRQHDSAAQKIANARSQVGCAVIDNSL